MIKFILHTYFVFTIIFFNNVNAQMLPQYNYVIDQVLIKIKNADQLSLSKKVKILKELNVLSNQIISSNKNNLNGLLQIKLNENQEVSSMIKMALKNKKILLAQPNYYFSRAATPNDIFLTQQWAVANIAQSILTTSFVSPSQSPEDLPYTTNNPGSSGMDLNLKNAWNKVVNCNSNPIAILDTGVNYNHDDLIGNMWDGATCKNEAGTTINNCIHGYDYVNGDKDPADDDTGLWHGTMIAGIIGAAGNNGVGISGVCWNAQIIAVKVLDAAGVGTSLSISNGIKFAINNGATVINMSFSGSTAVYSNATIKTNIQTAINNGITVVTAAGNLGTDNDLPAHQYPCDFFGYTTGDSICVGALDQKYNLATISNFGATSVDVSAPGTNIYGLSGDPTNNVYHTLNGTSMSAAYVSGIAALYRSYNPLLAPAADVATQCDNHILANTQALATRTRNAIINGGDTVTALAAKTVSGKAVDSIGAFDYLGPITGVTHTP